FDSTPAFSPLQLSSWPRPQPQKTTTRSSFRRLLRRRLASTRAKLQGVVFDHPDLIALAVVGDGEAETGRLATSWHSNKFLNPIRDGAVLPVLHLNGYKINNPTLLARISHEELEALFVGYGYTPLFVEGSDPKSMHQAMAATLEHAVLEIRKIQQEARTSGKAKRPRWPMIILRSPKGWTAPPEMDGHYLEGFWRAHQIRLATVNTD